MIEYKKISLMLKNPVSSIGLLGGDLGKLLYLEISRNINKEDLETQLNHSLQIVSNKEVKLDFCVGLAGLSWLFQYFNSKNAINVNINELFDETDEYLHKWMINQINIGNYDFLHGAVGVGVYFLSRTSSSSIAKSYIEDLIDGLDKIAIRETSNTVKFEARVDPNSDLRGYNLSLSHGLASIIYFLTNAIKQEIYVKKASELLNGAVTYLISSKLPPSSEYNSIFPNWVCDQHMNNSSRLAWCYGDLGIAAALYRTGIILKNKKWEDIAMDALHETAKRKDLKQNGVNEAIICHGTAGIGHVFHRMFINTGKAEFKTTAGYWFNETKKMMRFGEKNDDFRIWGGPEKGWTNNVNILGGISGVALAYYCWENNINPDWDECLLLS